MILTGHQLGPSGVLFPRKKVYQLLLPIRFREGLGSLTGNGSHYAVIVSYSLEFTTVRRGLAFLGSARRNSIIPIVSNASIGVSLVAKLAQIACDSKSQTISDYLRGSLRATSVIGDI